MKERRFIASDDVLHAKTHAISGGHADGRRAANPQHLDGFPRGLDVAAVDFDKLDRQPRLVDQPQMPIDSADPMEGLRVFMNAMY